ncbi:hypothetical protein H0A36_26940 [Endozoicomonas sp. SM1973]|uniref:Uncharacterized protein n=1 Tax=Spartinivicinus marinus TaxID=2994442 RepID=A0A853IKQ1_9GAMM|nr:hypothetical protein [Spartinivicinus marinus]MCX4030515.1 hypothetical protein [Spartinivicinus marinus]NYZ69655.1 hypothetical protein [Spartinivicinus marinus]
MSKVFGKAEKIIMALIWAIPGAFIGALVRLFSYPTTFESVSSLLWQYVPWMLGFSILLGAFGFLFPRISALILEFLLSIEIGK